MACNITGRRVAARVGPFRASLRSIHTDEMRLSIHHRSTIKVPVRSDSGAALVGLFGPSWKPPALRLLETLSTRHQPGFDMLSTRFCVGMPSRLKMDRALYAALPLECEADVCNPCQGPRTCGYTPVCVQRPAFLKPGHVKTRPPTACATSGLAKQSRAANAPTRLGIRNRCGVPPVKECGQHTLWEAAFMHAGPAVQRTQFGRRAPALSAQLA